MKKAKKFKIISILLTISLFLTGVPVSAIGLSNDSKAENLNANNPTEQIYTKADVLTQEELSQYVQYESAQSLGHVKLLEQTENTLTYLNYDNTKTLYYYGTDIAYLDSNGKLVEKDITLQANTNQSAYSMKSNDIQTILPQNISEGVSITHNGKSATLTPIFSNNQQQLAVNADNIPLVSASASLNSQENAITYSSTFGNSTSITYTPLLNGIKEDIILQQYTGISEFSFLLETNGMGVYYDEEAELFYTASAEDVQDGFVIGRIYVYDNSDKLEIGTTTITILEENEKYLLTISVNPEFLSASDTVYPVTIDPTLTFNQTSQIKDAIVYSGYPNNSYGGYQYAYVGKYSNYGVGRLLVGFSELKTFLDRVPSATDIRSANLYLYCGTSSSASSLRVYYYQKAWQENNIKYSTVDWSKATLSNSTPAINIPTIAGWYNFNITPIVQDWKYSPYNTNIIIQNTDETTASKVKCFRTKEYATAHNGTTMPYLTMTYDGTLPSAKPDNGVYMIRNKASGKYLDVEYASTENGANIAQHPKNNGDNQKWYIEFVSDGMYSIKPLHASTKCLNVEGAASTNNTNVQLFSYNSNDNACLWEIKLDPQGYVYFQPVCARGLFLGIQDNSIEDGGNAVIQTMDYNCDSQKWYLESTDLTASSIELSQTSLKLDVGDSATLTATVFPSILPNKNVTWTSSDSSVVSVNSSGLVKAIGTGSAIITVRSQDNPNISTTCDVTISDKIIHFEGHKAFTFTSGAGEGLFIPISFNLKINVYIDHMPEPDTAHISKITAFTNCIDSIPPGYDLNRYEIKSLELNDVSYNLFIQDTIVQPNWIFDSKVAYINTYISDSALLEVVACSQLSVAIVPYVEYKLSETIDIG